MKFIYPIILILAINNTQKERILYYKIEELFLQKKYQKVGDIAIEYIKKYPRSPRFPRILNIIKQIAPKIKQKDRIEKQLEPLIEEIKDEYHKLLILKTLIEYYKLTNNIQKQYNAYKKLINSGFASYKELSDFAQLGMYINGKEKTIKVLKKYSKKYPVVYTIIGKIYWSFGNIKQAEEYFKKALNYFYSLKAFTLLGKLYISTNRKDKAKTLWLNYKKYGMTKDIAYRLLASNGFYNEAFKLIENDTKRIFSDCKLGYMIFKKNKKEKLFIEELFKNYKKEDLTKCLPVIKDNIKYLLTLSHKKNFYKPIIDFIVLYGSKETIKNTIEELPCHKKSEVIKRFIKNIKFEYALYSLQNLKKKCKYPSDSIYPLLFEISFYLRKTNLLKKSYKKIKNKTQKIKCMYKIYIGDIKSLKECNICKEISPSLFNVKTQKMSKCFPLIFEYKLIYDNLNQRDKKTLKKLRNFLILKFLGKEKEAKKELSQIIPYIKNQRLVEYELKNLAENKKILDIKKF